MKYLPLFTVSLVVSHAVAIPLEKRQGSLGSLVGGFLNSGYGKVADVAGAGPRRVETQSRVAQVAASKTVKIRYGPYKVPNMSKKQLTGESGTLYNYPDVGVEKPCGGDCVLLGVSAGLEYPDGTDANTNTGMWLHHMVAFTVGAGRMDPTCVGKMSLPHMVIDSDASKAERFFSSGNERTIASFNPPFVKDKILGYHLNAGDKFSFIVDLMNQNMEDKVVYMTLTYDYVDGRPEGIDNIKAIWLDAAQCGTSEIMPPKQNGDYSVKYKWTANIDGDILGAGGHLHDGGTHLTLAVDGKQICDSVASYGKGGKPMGGSAGGAMAGMGDAATPANGTGNVASSEHIISMTPCFGDKLGLKDLKKGQTWELEAFYDYSKHSGMTHENGKQENVMGIAIMYVKNAKM